MMYKLTAFLVLTFALSSVSAQHAIWGNITNSYGEKMEGASVFIPGSDKGAVTDFEGYYSLEDVSSKEQTIKVTYLGYEDVMIKVFPTSDTMINIVLEGSIFQIDDIIISANKLDEQSPFSYTEQNKEQINFKNLAQDVPFLLEHTPSVVVTSDAGAGIGYTGMRIRGSDATRINVTINGIPLNDSESHGVFWVDLPDFATSVNEIQVQRGVGPSTNGAGAFGGTIGLETNYLHQNPFIVLEGTIGSFNTLKRSGSFNTGLMNNKYSLQGRVSLIDSDGFIDRSDADLSSWFFSAAKVDENKSLRINIFSGKERTNQAWNGVPEVKFNQGSEEALLAHYFNNSNGDYNTVEDSLNLFDSDFNKYNTYLYPDQVDDYRQTHAQLLYANAVSDNFKVNGTLHYTKGKGFFEQFRYDDDLEDYNISSDEFTSANIVRRRWLDNDFFGTILTGELEASDNLTVTAGLGYNTYLGDHFGEVITAEVDSVFLPGFSRNVADSGQEYYRNDATKTDLNAFLKGVYNLNSKLQLFGDLQIRAVNYGTDGVDSDLQTININANYSFFNPKFGLSYNLNDKTQLYTSFARAHREPVRSDFIDRARIDQPLPEVLDDIELGLRGALGKASYAANVYYMDYKDQLVLSGAINDVGSPLRDNVDNSFRAGIELSASYNFNEFLSWSPNLTLSTNKIDTFVERLGDETIIHENTDISFSPSIIAGSILTYSPLHNLELSLLSKFVGKQYLDNTTNDDRSLPSYFVNDILASYTIETDVIQRIQFKLLLNNIFSTIYSSNGYTYSYIYGGLITENYVYPQAERNFLLSVSVTF